jgi:hypothetical protein
VPSTIFAFHRRHFRWCEQLIKRKFPQCGPANRETSCLLEIGDFSWKLQLPVSLVCPRPISYEATHNAVLSNHLSLHPSSVQVFSAPCSQTPTVYVPTVMLRDQVSHPCRTIDKIIVLYNRMLTILDSRRGDSGLWSEW